MPLTYLENRHNKFDSGWTDERVACLRQLWSEGLSASQISRQFKLAFTRSAVLGKVHRLGLEAREPRQPARSRLKRANGVPKPPPRPPSPQPSAPRMRALTFFKLKPHHCHFPLGNWYEPARLFCGADKELGEIYCPFHRRMARARGAA